MAITISADDPRTIRALEIAAQADRWVAYRDADGHTAYRVPSQSAPGRAYLVTSSSCDCADFRNSLSTPAADDEGEQRACKHILAVRLFAELVRAQQLQSRPTASRQRAHLRLVHSSEAATSSSGR